ncbi:hypothetical protein ACHWQZ_G012410 [Mnemiopsis leidyi]
MAIRHSHVIFFGCTAFFCTFSGYVFYTERSDKQKLKKGRNQKKFQTMVRKRQANLERFAGSIATLVGGQQRKSRAGQKIGKPKFQLDRKKERKLKKEAKKEKRLKHILVKAGAQLPEAEEPGKVENEAKKDTMKKKKKSKENFIASRDNMQSLQSKQEKLYKAAGSSKMTKEEAEIANKKEDRVIKDMEKRLGFRKKKKIKRPSQ